MKRDLERVTIINRVANEYITACSDSVSNARLHVFVEKYPYRSLGYSSLQSMIAAVSKLLNIRGFSKKKLALELVASSYKKFESLPVKQEAIKMIQADLSQHRLNAATIRDYLQQLDLLLMKGRQSEKFEIFIKLIQRGHSYKYSLQESQLSSHSAKKAKHWFLITHGGDKRETLNHRRTQRQHVYKNLKDFFLLESNQSKVCSVWTAIGFIFADGSNQSCSLQIVITESDKYYLSEYCIPALLDDTSLKNSGPSLIAAHSNAHESSYRGSKPVARAHLDDSQLASFFSELGLPSNKTQCEIELSPRITDLPDQYFFCFLAGLFSGDGCFSRQSEAHVHLGFDLHREEFCRVLASQIGIRTGIKMDVGGHYTKKGIKHFKLAATTNWRAISLLMLMLFYAPFHLRRKVDVADRYISELIKAVPAYSFLGHLPSDFVSGTVSSGEMVFYLAKLKCMSKQQA